MTQVQAPLTQIRAVIELVLAGLMWGLGFVAVVWCLREAGPLAISGWRFIIAGATGLLFARRFIFSAEARTFMKFAWLPGAMIALLIGFQTWGLMYTTATKSGFLTTLYVLIVPLMEPFFGGSRPTRKLFLCSILALLGVGLMCGVFSGHELDARTRFNVGDLLTLVCAFAASAHILVIAKVHKKLGPHFNGFHFNTAQSFGAGLPTLALALLIEPGSLKMPWHLVDVVKLGGSALPLIGMLSLTFCSTLIGFTLQVRAQRVLSPSTASLLFLLESPFGAMFAFIFLDERMGPTQLLGGVLILASVAYSTYSSIKKA